MTLEQVTAFQHVPHTLDLTVKIDIIVACSQETVVLHDCHHLPHHCLINCISTQMLGFYVGLCFRVICLSAQLMISGVKKRGNKALGPAGQARY